MGDCAAGSQGGEDTAVNDPVDYVALLSEFEKLVLDANDPNLPTRAILPISERLNAVRLQLQRKLEGL